MTNSRNCTQNGQTSKFHSEWPKVQIALRMEKNPNCSQNGQKSKLDRMDKIKFAVLKIINLICTRSEWSNSKFAVLKIKKIICTQNGQESKFAVLKIK